VSDFAYNIAKGRAVEFFNRVDANDPAASTLTVIPVDVAAVTDATLKDLDDFAAIITAGVTERNANNWNRKTITDTDLAFPAPNDAGDSYDVSVTALSFVWSPGPTAGAVTDLIICYASVATPTNAQLLPVAQYDFPITPDGSDVTATINASGLYRAS
jgi:hypothetical protein